MKTGIVLEGGAMRGMFSAGVTDVLMEQGISFDGVIGVSAGAAFGCNIKSGQIGRAVRYNTRFCADKRYCGIGSLIKTGNIYNTEFCYEEVPLKHDPFDFDAYHSSPTRFYVVATDVETGKPVYHEYGGYSDHGLDWIRASASMPLVSQIVEIDGKKLLDGGMTDSIPLKYFESIGYTKSIVVLTRPKGYTKGKNRAMPLIRLKYKKYPQLVRAMETRHVMYAQQLKYIAEREQRGEILVIRPETDLPVSRLERDSEKLKAAYNIGREAALARIEEIKSFLTK